MNAVSVDASGFTPLPSTSTLYTKASSACSMRRFQERPYYMAWVDLCKVSELSEGEGRFVGVDDKNIAIFLIEGKVHVFDDTCPHAGGSLAGGMIEEGFVVCPWHYWAFNVETGRMQGGGRARIRVYSTRIVGEGADAVVQADL